VTPFRAAQDRDTKLGRRSTLADEVANRIPAEKAGGTSLAALADGLNADGVQTGQGGRRWYPSTVRSVFMSSKIVGRRLTTPRGPRTKDETSCR
jgi:hypothetical protein